MHRPCIESALVQGLPWQGPALARATNTICNRFQRDIVDIADAPVTASLVPRIRSL
mgnify:CR=1 FL=1